MFPIVLKMLNALARLKNDGEAPIHIEWHYIPDTGIFVLKIYGAKNFATITLNIAYHEEQIAK